MFDRCDFVFCKNQSLVILIPAHLPHAETYTVSASHKDIKFKAGYSDIVTIDYRGGKVFERLTQNIQVGLVEYIPGEGIPDCITNVAYVEIRRAH